MEGKEYLGSVEEFARNVRANPKDQAAWTVLVRLANERLLRIAIARVRHVEDAKDVLQDTWAKASTSIESFDPARGSFMGWIYTILHNTALDLLRARRRQPAHVPLDLLDDVRAADDPVELAIAREQLRDLLAQVPSNIRLALVDHFAGGIPWRDVAATLGVSDTTLRDRVKVFLDAWRSRWEEAPSLGEETS